MLWLMSRFLIPGGRSTFEKSNLKRLLLKSMVVKPVFLLPNKNDASPVNSLLDKSSAASLALPKDLGIEPDSLLKERSRLSWGFLNEPKLSGMDPVSWFCLRSSSLSRGS